MITQEKLKANLTYCANTGNFKWVNIDKYTHRVKAGDIAGWVDDKYHKIMINGKSYRSHRLAWLYVYGYMPSEIDHIDHDGLNNKLVNLREVTRDENLKNKPKYCNNKSGVTGVTWRKDNNKWFSFISYKGKRKHLGSRGSLFDAVCLRKAAEHKYGYHPNHGHN